VLPANLENISLQTSSVLRAILHVEPAVVLVLRIVYLASYSQIQMAKLFSMEANAFLPAQVILFKITIRKSAHHANSLV
jgi:hypothetical protein